MGSQNQKWQREFEQLEARWLAYTATGQATLSQLRFWESVKDFQIKAGFITERQRESVLKIIAQNPNSNLQGQSSHSIFLENQGEKHD